MLMHGEYRMTGTGPAVVGQALAALELEEIETRFGRVAVNAREPIFFPSGMLGMPASHRYCLTHFPTEKMERFKLLQSLDDTTLSFITLPVDLNNPIIERADLELAARDMGFALEDVAVLLVVSVHREPMGVRISVNARAPVLMQVSRRTAAQYVFANTKYLIRQPLSM